MTMKTVADAVSEPYEPLESNILPTHLGRGFDTLTGNVKNDVLKTFTTDVAGSSGDMMVVVEYDYSKIREKIGVKSNGKIEWGSSSVKILVDFSDELNVEETCVYVFWFQRFIEETVYIKRGTGFELTDEAKRYLDKSPLDKQNVYTNLGNKIISRLSNGAEFGLLATFSSRSLEESKKIKARLDANTKIFTSEAELHVQLDYLRQEVNKNISYRIQGKAIGGDMDLNKLSNPATAAEAIEEWKKSFSNKKKLVPLDFGYDDLNYVDDRFTPVVTMVDQNQDVSNKLDRMIVNVADSKAMAIEYQSSRDNLGLPQRASIAEAIKRCEPLKADLMRERTRLNDTAATARFVLDQDIEKRYYDLRHITPVFDYRDLGQGQTCGFTNSGMPLFGTEMEHVKYFATMEMLTDVGLQGFRVYYDTFDSPDRHKGEFAQTTGHYNLTVVNMEKDPLMSMYGWEHQRGDYKSVQSLHFTSLSGKDYGPMPPLTRSPDASIEGSNKEGEEKYIIGLWGRGNNWTQLVGPFFRQCLTEYPYKDE